MGGSSPWMAAYYYSLLLHQIQDEEKIRNCDFEAPKILTESIGFRIFFRVFKNLQPGYAVKVISYQSYQKSNFS